MSEDVPLIFHRRNLVNNSGGGKGGNRPRVLGTLIDDGFTFERWGRLV